MQEAAKQEGFILKDYFEFIVDENKEDEDLLISVDVKPKGKEILEKKKALDPTFNEEDYFQKLIRKALEAYIAEHESEPIKEE